MARDPGSVWTPLPEAGAPDGLTKDMFIVHSTGTRASAAANARYFARTDVVVESTFIVGLTPADPTVQVMDSTDNADANGAANRRGISVEVVGLANDPYTPHQESEIIRLGRWSRAEHPIPARIIPSANEGGCGWHVMFGAPGPWTSVKGKECPGGVRISRLKSHLFPAIFGGAAPAAVPSSSPFAFPIGGSILAAFTRTGGLAVLGPPKGPEVPTGDKAGRWQEFINGAAFWHPRYGGPAYTVQGDIYRAYSKIGREAVFGWPITDEKTTPDQVGRYNHFDGNRSIYWHPLTGAVPIFGGIREAWATSGWEKGPLGYPTGPEQPGEGGIVQRFQKGSILWGVGATQVRAG